MTLSLKSLKKEISEIKEIMTQAINEGRNSLAIWGKFDTLFSSFNTHENEIVLLIQRMKELEKQIKEIVRTKCEIQQDIRPEVSD